MARFDEERKALNPQRVEVVTPAMAKLLAERLSANILGMDERLRKEPETARLLLQAALLPNPARPPHRPIRGRRPGTAS